MADVDHIPWHELGQPDRVLTVGDYVWDDLTQTSAKVIGIEVHDGQTPGIWLDNEHVGGGRHPWEVSMLLRAEDQHSTQHKVTDPTLGKPEPNTKVRTGHQMIADLRARLAWQSQGWDFPGHDVHEQIGQARILFGEALAALAAAERVVEAARRISTWRGEPDKHSPWCSAGGSDLENCPVCGDWVVLARALRGYQEAYFSQPQLECDCSCHGYGDGWCAGRYGPCVLGAHATPDARFSNHEEEAK